MAVPQYGEVLDAIGSIRWPARKAVSGSIPGAHVSKMRGVSSEFTEYRPYRQGDDLKRIDWKLFARTDRAYIRLSNDRALLPTSLVLDASASMAFPVDTQAKWTLACLISIGLVSVAHRSSDPVGMVVSSSDQTHQLPPRTRRDIIGQMASLLGSISLEGNPNLEPGLQAAMRNSRRIVILSDFLGEIDDLIKLAGQHLVAGGEVHAVHIVDRQEMDPPEDIPLFEDPEMPELRRPLVDDARRAYLTNFADWRASVADQWQGMGASYVLAVAGVDRPEQVIRRVAELPATERSS